MTPAASRLRNDAGRYAQAGLEPLEPLEPLRPWPDEESARELGASAEAVLAHNAHAGGDWDC